MREPVVCPAFQPLRAPHTRRRVPSLYSIGGTSKTCFCIGTGCYRYYFRLKDHCTVAFCAADQGPKPGRKLHTNVLVQTRDFFVKLVIFYHVHFLTTRRRLFSYCALHVNERGMACATHKPSSLRHSISDSCLAYSVASRITLRSSTHAQEIGDMAMCLSKSLSQAQCDSPTFHRHAVSTL